MSSIRALTVFSCLTAAGTVVPTHLCLEAQTKLWFPQIPPEKWHTPPCRPSSPLTQSEKAHSHLYLRGSFFFFKEQHHQHYGIWKTPSMTGESRSVTELKTWHTWKTACQHPQRGCKPLKIFKCILRPVIQTSTCSLCLSHFPVIIFKLSEHMNITYMMEW